MAGKPSVSAMARRYRDGASITSLAARYGMSAPTVRKRLVAHGVVIRSPGRPTSDTAGPDWHLEAMQLRLDGMAYPSIGVRLGKSAGVVRQTLSRMRRGAV